MGLSGDTPIFLFTPPESNPSHPPTPPIHPKTQLTQKPQAPQEAQSPIVPRPSFSGGIKKEKATPTTDDTEHPMQHTSPHGVFPFPYVSICLDMFDTAQSAAHMPHSGRRQNQSGSSTKSSLPTPHRGHTQSLGISSNAVPGAIPPSGSPTAGS